MAKKSATHDTAPDDDQEIAAQSAHPEQQDVGDPPLSAQLQAITGQLARQQTANAPIPSDMVGKLADIVQALEDLGV